ncbi:MAG: hypothetical protein ACTTKA_07045 [Tannerella sp.]
MILKVKTNMRAAAVSTLTKRIVEMYRTNAAPPAENPASNE